MIGANSTAHHHMPRPPSLLLQRLQGDSTTDCTEQHSSNTQYQLMVPASIQHQLMATPLQTTHRAVQQYSSNTQHQIMVPASLQNSGPLPHQHTPMNPQQRMYGTTDQTVAHQPPLSNVIVQPWSRESTPAQQHPNKCLVTK